MVVPENCCRTNKNQTAEKKGLEKLPNPLDGNEREQIKIEEVYASPTTSFIISRNDFESSAGISKAFSSSLPNRMADTQKH